MSNFPFSHLDFIFLIELRNTLCDLNREKRIFYRENFKFEKKWHNMVYNLDWNKMALSDAQVSKQIEQMISFIQKESEEKIEEIEIKVINWLFIECFVRKIHMVLFSIRKVLL